MRYDVCVKTYVVSLMRHFISGMLRELRLLGMVCVLCVLCCDVCVMFLRVMVCVL